MGDNWEDILPELEFALNTKVYTSTGHTPWFLTFGEHPQFPWRTDPTPRYSETDAANRFRTIQYASELVKQTDTLCRKASKRMYDKKTQQKTFKMDDPVLLHFKDPPVGTNPKYYRPWKGLYYIKEVLGTSYFKVAKPGSRSYKTHANRMKHFDP